MRPTMADAIPFEVVRSDDGTVVRDWLSRTQADILATHLQKTHTPHHVRTMFAPTRKQAQK